MKRIKIMLLSLFVLATVGGVLAFKAAKTKNFVIYQKVGTTCPKILTVQAVEITNDPLVQPIFYTTSVLGAPATVPTTFCTLRTTEVIQD